MEFKVGVGEWRVRCQGSGVSSQELGFNAETQSCRVRREILELERGRFDGRVERVDRVEILCRIHYLVHQSYTVHLILKNLTLFKHVYVRGALRETSASVGMFANRIPLSQLPKSDTPPPTEKKPVYIIPDTFIIKNQSVVL